MHIRGVSAWYAIYRNRILLPRSTIRRRAHEYFLKMAKGGYRMEGEGNMATLVAVLRDLRDPINQFFNDVLIMDDDPKIRNARLALIQRIRVATGLT